MSIATQVRKIAQLTGHNSGIFALTNGTSNKEFISGAGDGWVVRWQFDQPELGQLIAKVETQIFSLIHLQTAEKIVAGNMNGGLHWIDLNAPDATKNVLHHQKGVFGFQKIADWLFSIGGDGVLTKWSITSSQSIESLQLSAKSLRSILFSKTRGELIIGASDQHIYIVDPFQMILKQRIENAHESSVFSLCLLKDDGLLLSGGRDAHLASWETANNYQPIRKIPAHLFTINAFAVHPNGHILATASRDKTIKIWDAESLQLLKVIEPVRDQGHLNSVNCLYWSTHDNYLVSGSDDRSLIVWSVE